MNSFLKICPNEGYALVPLAGNTRSTPSVLLNSLTQLQSCRANESLHRKRMTHSERSLLSSHPPSAASARQRAPAARDPREVSERLDSSKLQTARFRLYQRRSWPPNSHFSAFVKIYKIFMILRRSNLKIPSTFS